LKAIKEPQEGFKKIGPQNWITPEISSLNPKPKRKAQLEA
jgi:hypothetical protein